MCKFILIIALGEKVANFEIGDMVTLISGSAMLTVEYRAKNGKYHCIWLDGNAFTSDDIDGKALTPVIPKKAS